MSKERDYQDRLERLAKTHMERGDAAIACDIVTGEAVEYDPSGKTPLKRE